LLDIALSTTELVDLPRLTVSWVGDANNILNSMLVTYPRLGLDLRVATPNGYPIEQDILDFCKKSGPGSVVFTNDPLVAVQGADVIVTDTWTSMGQESEKQQRIRDFSGFQVTEQMARMGGAKPDWKFLHCLPRKEHEVDDQVFF
jgi:ornithine carbamoyltransferase